MRRLKERGIYAASTVNLLSRWLRKDGFKEGGTGIEFPETD
jgi:hypothetical protein